MPEEQTAFIYLYSLYNIYIYTLTILTPTIETPDPPFMTPRKGPQNRWQLDTLADIPRILNQNPILHKLFEMSLQFKKYAQVRCFNKNVPLNGDESHGKKRSKHRLQLFDLVVEPPI